MKEGKLILLPGFLGDAQPQDIFPQRNLTVLKGIDYFICEHAKQLRYMLKACGIPSPYDHIKVFELNKHTKAEGLDQFMEVLWQGKDIGLVSDAGCPGIADPGNLPVLRAHELGAKVVPLIGPSSIYLALMASGLNGQNFHFHGYLPVNKSELKHTLKQLESSSRKTEVAQIFIETPYRNQKTFEALCKQLQKSTLLCIARSLSTPNEHILTLPIGHWEKMEISLPKEPAVFIFQAER